MVESARQASCHQCPHCHHFLKYSTAFFYFRYNKKLIFKNARNKEQQAYDYGTIISVFGDFRYSSLPKNLACWGSFPKPLVVKNIWEIMGYSINFSQ